jgi:hypothetical protein
MQRSLVEAQIHGLHSSCCHPAIHSYSNRHKISHAFLWLPRHIADLHLFTHPKYVVLILDQNNFLIFFPLPSPSSAHFFFTEPELFLADDSTWSVLEI